MADKDCLVEVFILNEFMRPSFDRPLRPGSENAEPNPGGAQPPATTPNGTTP